MTQPSSYVYIPGKSLPDLVILRSLTSIGILLTNVGQLNLESVHRQTVLSKRSGMIAVDGDGLLLLILQLFCVRYAGECIHWAVLVVETGY